MIQVKVDKRTELLGIMLLISDYSKKNSKLIEECGNKDYRDSILKNFSKFKEDITIKLLNDIINNYCFNYDAPIYLISQLNEDYSYDNLLDYPFRERLDGAKIVLDFLDSIKKFVKRINFDDFYNKNATLFEKGIKQIETLIKNYDVVNFMKKFYKNDFESVKFTINLMFFATRGNYGININNNFICNQCLYPSENGDINFIDSVDNILTLYVHEFSHSIVNPLTRKFSKVKIEFFDNIVGKFGSYKTPETIIDEHIVRSVELLYLKYFFKTNDNVNYFEKWKNDYKDIGFIYIEDVFSKLEYYFLNQNKFKSFEKYFPQILKVFETKKEDI